MFYGSYTGFGGHSSAAGYTPRGAVYFDGAADYLTWTPSGAASSDTDKTISFWVKRAKFGSVQWILDAGSNNDQIQYTAADKLEVSLNATIDTQYTTTAVFRDPTAWTNVVVAFDTNNGTAALRKQLWINGSLIADADLDTHADPSDGSNVDWMKASVVQNIGRRGNNSQWFCGYLTDFIGVDGALDASSFGETDATTGIWVPKDPSKIGNFGNNGFWLDFADGNNLGLDKSAGATEPGHVGFQVSFDGSDAATGDITEESITGHTVTLEGTAQLDTAQKKFGTASLLLDGDSDYASIADHAILEIGTNDFTAEMWIRFAGSKPTDTRAILSKWLNTGNKRSFQLAFDGSADDLIFYVGSGSGIHHTISGSWTPSADTWYHVAVARYSGTITTYVNGGVIASGAGANSFDANDYAWEIGRANAGSYFPGHIDEVRLITDYARYTGAFTAPTAAFSTPVKNNSFIPTSMGPSNIAFDGPVDDVEKTHLLGIGLDHTTLTKTAAVISNNNLRFRSAAGSAWHGVRTNMGISGTDKIYWEVVNSEDDNNTWVAGVGSKNAMLSNSPNTATQLSYIQPSTTSGKKYDGTGNTPANHSVNDIWGFAVDYANQDLYLSKNNAWWNGSAFSGTGPGTIWDNTLSNSVELFPVAQGHNNGETVDFRFATSTWSYSAPSTYTAFAGETLTGVGNYWTLNPLASTEALTNGNLSFTGEANFTKYVTAPALPITGKWYWEVTVRGGDQTIKSTASYDAYIGVVKADVAIPTGSHTSNADLWVWGNMNPSPAGSKHNNSTVTMTPTTAFGDGSVIMTAVDMDNSKIWWGNDGTWAGSGNPATASNPAFTNLARQVMPYQENHSDLATYNFGATPFAHTPPSGFVALNTSNITAPDITKPSDHFKAIIYQGTGAELSTGDTDVPALDFKPDFVWIKNRDTTDAHMLYDSVREATKDLHPSTEDQESTTAQTLKSFDANGFTLGTDVQVNTSSENYVAWCLKAGGAPTTDNDNTSGAMDDGSVFKGGVVQSSYTPAAGSNYPKKMSIASHGGFSIIEYTGTGANATVPHGLDTTPTFFMVKPLTQDHGWAGYHSAIGTGSGNDKVIRFDTTTIGDQLGTAWQNDPFATDDVITFGNQIGQNQDTTPHIMYVWARVPGLIGIGSYYGNSSADGTYVTIDDGACGFRPAWVMTKRIDDNSGDWWITDTARTPYNTMSIAIYIDAQAEEDANDNRIDFLANGFKLRDVSARRNTALSGTTNNFIYLAFADDAFNFNNRPL